ncbi:hypothetical protein [Hyphomicrobium sp. 99]|uniref:hypothetical protein n=1 Tax=Hyphomicrobium sp. 99 TaxID=1163419 RepID=UPI001AEC1288|nr:hypothetical protein [Hyphomicrobium sp. 99]
MQLNHYVLKSHEEWLKKRMKGRGSLAASTPSGARHNIGENHFTVHDRNQEDDTRILDFMNRLRDPSASRITMLLPS